MNKGMPKTSRRRYWLAIVMPLAAIILLLASAPAVSAASVVAKTVTAPTSGTLDIQVAFNGPFTSGQQIAYQTVDGTAKAGVDFVGIPSDTKNCPNIGNPCPTLFANVTILGNATYKVDVSFQVCYLNTTNCGTITIQSGLPAPSSPPTQQTQSITFNSLGGKTYGDAPFNVSASASSGLTVAFSSQTTGVCTVTGTQVTIVGAGDCTIRASQAGNSAYFAAPDVDRSFTVSKANQSITFNPNPLPDKTYGDAPFTVSASASSGLGVSYGASGNCSASGAQITLTGAGSCTVTASQGGNANYNAAGNVQRTFSIAKGASNLTLDQASLGQTYDGTPRAVTATTNPSNLSGVTVTYQGTGDTTYPASTTPPTNAGTYAVTASLDNANYAATAATGTLAVAQAASTTTVSVTNATYDGGAHGGTAHATGAGELNQALPVTYSGRNATAYGPSTTPPTNAGDYTASATFAGDTNHTGSQDSGDFTIGKATASLTLTAGDLNRTYDGSPKAVGATIDPTGLTVVAVTYAGTGDTTYPASATPPTDAGTYTVTAQLTNANYTAAAADTLTIGKASQGITFGTPAASPAPGYTYGTNAGFTVGATATSGLPVGFVSSTPAVCTVAQTTVTIVGAGDCTIAASQPGDGNYLAATDAPRTFPVAQAPSTTTVAATDAAYTGNPYSGASATVTGFGGLHQAVTPLTYSGRNGTAYGPTTAAPTVVGDYTASATFPGDTDHTGSAGSADFRITRASQAITFGTPSPSPAPSYTYGTDASFTVGATATSGLPVGFASSTLAACTVSGTTVTIVGAGSCTITANQPGDGNYSSAPEVVRTFAIGKASQSIVFAMPSPPPSLGYTYGTDSGFTIGATASSGLAVSFSSQTPDVCTVSGTSVTIVGAGDCTIIASQSGDTSYQTATAISYTFTVAEAVSTTTVTSPGATYTGNPYTGASARVTGAGDLDQAVTPLSYSGRNGTTYGPSLIPPTNAGDYTASASFAGDTNHTGSSGSATFRITPANQAITFLPNPLPDRALGDAPFAVAASASSRLAVTFAAGPTGVCTLSGATVTLVGVGDCTVTASQAGDANHLAAPAVVHPFRVVRAATALTGVRGDATYGDATLVLSATVTRTADGKPVPAGGAVAFTFGGHSYPATTDARGVATATAPLPTGQGAGTFADRVQAAYAGTAAALPSSGTGPLVVARRILLVKPTDQTVKLGQPTPTACTLQLAPGSAFLPGDGWASINLTNLRCTTTRNYPASNASETVGKAYKISATGATSANYDIRYQQGTLTVAP